MILSVITVIWKIININTIVIITKYRDKIVYNKSTLHTNHRSNCYNSIMKDYEVIVRIKITILI